MDEIQLKEWCLQQMDTEEIIKVPEEIFASITHEQAEQVAITLSGKKMVYLPQKEIVFFEWLKEKDPAVWEDLWGDDLYPPYVVSASLLPYLIEEDSNGFPICDLEKNTNYFFSLKFMQDEEAQVIIEAARNRLLAKMPLELSHRLALEVSLAPIDIWHFAYKYDIEIEDAKKAVDELVDDYALVHLKDAEHISLAMQI